MCNGKGSSFIKHLEIYIITAGYILCVPQSYFFVFLVVCLLVFFFLFKETSDMPQISDVFCVLF